MSEPKTLTLAPEQQAKLSHLVEREMDESYYTGLYMKAKDARACLREFAVEVLEELGVPVAARDEAAELRAAARKWREAADRAREVRVSWLERRMEYTVGEVNEAVEALVEAEGVLRRLAGGESES